MTIIDTHHHFWKYSPEEYGWISDAMSALRRDFLPADLKHELDAAQVTGAISVQARQSLAETDWLLDIAETHEFLLGVVGWAPLADPGVEPCLEQYAARPKCKGFRHVAQDEPDDFLLSPDFNRGVALLKKYKLRYDILIFERQLPAAIALVDKHPAQEFILDHIAKPRIKEGALEPWASNIRELARRENVTCKISGMITEADWRTWNPQVLQPYLDTVLDAFGPGRLMLGTDWPVMLVAGGYGQWVKLVRSFVSQLSEAEQTAILSETALLAYGL